MHTTISLQFFYPYEPTLSAVIDPTLFDKPKVQETREGEEWTATYYVVVTSPEKDYKRHIDWVIENHGRKDWEELLMLSGRIVSERSDPNYNFDAYYDKVHSEVASQSAGPWADQASGRLDS
tara:strand:+ start:167 stop:532 length:366 start_codon:yes stop_codon:yes gene_type:complete